MNIGRCRRVPSGMINVMPSRRIASIFVRSTSTKVTSWPASAKRKPNVPPKAPAPMMAILIFVFPLGASQSSGRLPASPAPPSRLVGRGLQSTAQGVPAEWPQGSVLHRRPGRTQSQNRARFGRRRHRTLEDLRKIDDARDELSVGTSKNALAIVDVVLHADPDMTPHVQGHGSDRQVGPA